jgi:hypothetical protein
MQEPRQLVPREVPSAPGIGPLWLDIARVAIGLEQPRHAVDSRRNGGGVPYAGHPQTEPMIERLRIRADYLNAIQRGPRKRRVPLP